MGKKKNSVLFRVSVASFFGHESTEKYDSKGELFHLKEKMAPLEVVKITNEPMMHQTKI